MQTLLERMLTRLQTQLCPCTLKQVHVSIVFHFFQSNDCQAFKKKTVEAKKERAATASAPAITSRDQEEIQREQLALQQQDAIKAAQKLLEDRAAESRKRKRSAETTRQKNTRKAKLGQAKFTLKWFGPQGVCLVPTLGMRSC